MPLRGRSTSAGQLIPVSYEHSSYAFYPVVAHDSREEIDRQPVISRPLRPATRPAVHPRSSRTANTSLTDGCQIAARRRSDAPHFQRKPNGRNVKPAAAPLILLTAAT
jgi:hypothetical protein